MGLIRKITQETSYRFLNFFKFDVTHKNGRESEYYVSSRAKNSDGLKAVTGKNNADGVVIYAICKGEPEKVVLIRQYRYPIGGYVYEFPAGLVEEGEDFNTSAVRELEEETGLTFLPIAADKMYQEPRFTTVGMTDESCATVYGYAEGKPSILGQEESEEIEIVLADKEEARRILKEERVALMCAYMLMRFIHEEDGRHFDFLKEE